MTRDQLSTAVEIAGFAAISVGSYTQFGLGTALLVSGVLLIVLGYLLGR
jgi:hypothetical protein